MSEDTVFNSAKGKRIITNGFLSSFPNPMRKVIKIEGSHVIVVPGEGKDHRFVFDNVYGPTPTSEEQSYQMILPPLLDSFFSSKSSTLLSLGGGGNTSWVLGKDQLAGQVAAPVSPAKNIKPVKTTVSPSLVRLAVSNILTRLSIPGSGFFGLSFACFEIYNDQVIDLLSKKKIDPREHNLPGLTSSLIRNLSEFEDALTLVLLNGKIRNGELRSHIFFRFSLLSSNEAAEKNSQPRASPKLARSRPETPKKSQESSTSPVLDIVMLAPYNSAAKEFLSSEQNAIKRSLLNLSHLVDKMNGDVTTAGISWRSFKLTQILQPSFNSPTHKIVATAHSYGHKTKLQESLWSFTLLDAINRLNDTNPTTPGLQSPKPTRTTTPHKDRQENGIEHMNGITDNKLTTRPETPPQWRPSGPGPSPPRPLSRENKANISNTSLTAINTSSNKLKHLKLNKKPSATDVTKLVNEQVYTRPTENGTLSVTDLDGGSSLMRDALNKSKLQTTQLLANHTQLVSQLENKLRVEREERIATEESLQKQLKQEREKRERMAKRFQNAQQLLDSKEKEVVKLTDIVDKLQAESQSKLGALEKVVKARNESYRQKLTEQEGVIKRHNLAFKALQDRVSDLMERKVLDMKQNKSQLSLSQLSIPSTFSPSSSRPSSAMPPLLPPKSSTIADKRDSLVLGSGDVLGVVSGNDVSRSEDEFELLQQLQKLIAEQVQDLAVVNQKVTSYEHDKDVIVSVESAVDDFEKRIDQMRYQVTDEFREYLDTVENEDIIAQLTDTIRLLGESFRTKIVINTPGNKKDGKYSELVGELEGEMEATEVLKVLGQQLRTTLEDQAESFVSVLEDMSKLTDEELSEDLRLPIVWEPMHQDLIEIQERLANDKIENENAKTFVELSSLHQWVHDQRLLFAHQRNLLDQICHKVIQLDEDDAQLQEEGEEEEVIEYDDEMEEREGEEGEREEREQGSDYGDEENEDLNYSDGDGDGYSSVGEEEYSSGRD